MSKDATFRDALVAALPRLRRFARTLAPSVADADDLVQAVCVRAMERSHLYDGEGRIESWLYTMMRNLWVSEIRKTKVRIGQGRVDANETVELRLDVNSEDITYGNELVKMVMALPEGLASVLLLVSVEGHSYKEAAAILDIPVGTVMSRMSGARHRLRTALGQAEAS